MDITEATIYEQYLPESLRDIAELIGLPSTLVLVKFWGGVMHLYIPGNMKPEYQLAQRLGFTAAKLLSDNYGNDYISVPRAAAAIRAIRDGEIKERHMHGESAPRLALRYGLTERQIWSIIGKDGGLDDQQLTLF